jgi:hypothetical protein
MLLSSCTTGLLGRSVWHVYKFRIPYIYKMNTKQYTIRGIPLEVDAVLKRLAKQSSKSFNQIALEALTLGAGQTLRPKRDFSQVIGSITKRQAAAMDEEIRLQRQLDADLWE